MLLQYLHMISKLCASISNFVFFLTDNVELVDKLFKSVFNANTDKEDTLEEIDNNESCVELS